MNDQIRPQFANPPPEKLDDWTRYAKQQRTLNDMIEEIHRLLWTTTTQYRDFLGATWDSESVEGSLSIDNVMAATMVRDKAKTMDGNEVAGKKLDTIVKSLNVVLKRYHTSRKERRQTVAGEVVPNDNASE